MSLPASFSPRARSVAVLGGALVAAMLVSLGCRTKTNDEPSATETARRQTQPGEPRPIRPSARHAAAPRTSDSAPLRTSDSTSRNSASAPLRTSDSAAPHKAAPQKSDGPKTFAAAKRLLRERVYADHRTTLYCDCPFDKSWKLELRACGYRPTGKTPRSLRVEWEHVVPAQAFGQSLPAWRDGDPRCVGKNGRPFRGRACARKTSALFRQMEADMHNLFPAVGDLNGRRSSFSMALIDGERRDLGTCDIEIADHKIEPRPAIRGDIARTYLYMDATYPGRGILSRKNSPLFHAWSEADPVDAWECERARRIQVLQPTPNEVLTTACQTPP